MLSTFKQYLITEKVQYDEYRTISSDDSFTVGFEFEFFENNIADNYEEIDDEFFQNDYRGLQEDYERWFSSVEEWVQDVITERQEIYDDNQNIIEQGLKERQSEFNELENEYNELEGQIGIEEDDDELERLENERDEIEEKMTELEDEIERLKEASGDNVDEIEDLVNVQSTDPSQFRSAIYLPTTSTELDEFFDRYGVSSEDLERKYYEVLYEEAESFDFSGIFEPDYYSDEYISEYNDYKSSFEYNVRNHLGSTFPFSYEIDEEIDNYWIIKPDMTVPIEEGGIEVISPPQRLSKALADMKTMFKYIAENGKTDSRCGLHINISIAGKSTHKIDVMKMILFAEEEYIKKLFPEREDSGFAQFLLDYLLKYSDKNVIEEIFGKNVKNLPSSNKNNKLYTQINNQIQELLNKLLPASKYHGINRLKAGVSDGWFEFRYVGGTDYEKKGDVISKQVLRFCYLLKLGSDVNFKRKEYLSKLSKFLSRITYSSKDIKVESHIIGTFKGNVGAGMIYYNPKDKMIYYTNTKDGKIVARLSVRQFHIELKTGKLGKVELNDDLDIIKIKNIGREPKPYHKLGFSKIVKFDNRIFVNRIVDGEYSLFGFYHTGNAVYVNDKKQLKVLTNNIEGVGKGAEYVQSKDTKQPKTIAQFLKMVDNKERGAMIIPHYQL